MAHSEIDASFNKLSKTYCEHSNRCFLKAEAISKMLGINSGTLRKWASAKRDSLKFDAEESAGGRGRVSLYSPADAVLFSVLSEMSHIGIAFKGNSQIERKILPSGEILQQYSLNDEVVIQVARQCIVNIYNIAGLKDAKNTFAKYVAIFYDGRFIQYIPVNRIDEVDNSIYGGLIALFDCVKISLRALACISGSLYDVE